MKFVFTQHVRTCVADTETPVSLYLKIREHFPECLLMESNGSSETQHRYSYICCLPLATITVDNNNIKKQYPDGNVETIGMDTRPDVIAELENFNSQFSIPSEGNPYDTQGLYGYMCYDALQYFESIRLNNQTDQDRKIEDLHFSFYSFVLVYDHFKQVCHNIEYSSEYNDLHAGEYIRSLLQKPVDSAYPFKTIGPERASCTDADFLQMVADGQQHCFRGDVFQVVLSRAFSIGYTGDDFAVYRTLRSINPSPYLFYFDYGHFRLLGSSPEAQLKVKDNKGSIHPIAGTYKRSGDADKDALQIEKLKADKKENAEHVMLVDLARNDLSKSYSDVQVSVYKEVVQYSHVIHMVSEVTGTQPTRAPGSLQVVADTFPAGTLSGAPKYKALQLIDRYEPEARGFYGGSIGFIGFNGAVNQAIMIRTILSKGQKLFYQAGAGIVASSVAAEELQEVNNKLQALRNAIQLSNI